MGQQQRFGLTVGTVFGLVYVLVNAGALPGPWPSVLRVAAVAAFIGVQLAMRAAAQRPVTDGGPAGSFTRGYWTIVAVEVVALFGGLVVLARVFDAGEAGVAWVSVVVGLHFLALAVVWREASLHVVGAAIAACGAVALVLTATGAGQAAVSGVGGVVPGWVLLAGGAWAATRGGRVAQSASAAAV